MKKATEMKNKIYQLFLSLIALAFPLLAYAQEDKPDLNVNVTTTKTTTEWYSEPIYWVIGAVVLIILVALIARGGKK